MILKQRKKCFSYLTWQKQYLKVQYAGFLPPGVANLLQAYIDDINSTLSISMDLVVKLMDLLCSSLFFCSSFKKYIKISNRKSKIMVILHLFPENIYLNKFCFFYLNLANNIL